MTPTPSRLAGQRRARRLPAACCAPSLASSRPRESEGSRVNTLGFGHGAGGVQSKAPSHGADALAVAERGAADVRRLGMDERVKWWERVAAAISEIEAAT